MEITIKGNPDEISVLIKNILSAGDRQDVENIISDKMLFPKNEY